MPTAATVNTVPAGASDQRVYQLREAGALTASETGAKVLLPHEFAYIVFELIITAVSGVIGDTLNVYVQQSWDGVNYDDLVSFAQVTGAGAPQVQQAAYPIRPQDAAPELHTHTERALAAGTARNTTVARQFRANVAVAGGGGSSWTVQVVAIPRVGR